ncbi:MAG: GAF domain-containing protein [Chloroflexota bacterium]
MSPAEHQAASTTGDASTLRRLRVIAVVAPLVFLVLIDARHHIKNPAWISAWPGTLLLGGIVALAALFFSEGIFAVFRRIRGDLAQRNQELLALHEAGLEIVGNLDLDSVLQRVVDEARQLANARYGALLVLDDAGGVATFHTSGLDPETLSKMGHVPVMHGVIGTAMMDGAPLRIDDLRNDPRSVGAPPELPPMHNVLAVPIRSHRVLGNLFVAESTTGVPFTVQDEATLTRFATQAALAIENATLHRQVRALATTEERERIAREMHDSLAQMLGYVNTKAQAVSELLRAGDTQRAEQHLDQLAAAARNAYADVREDILALRQNPLGNRGLAPSLVAYVEQWSRQSGISVTWRPSPPESLPAMEPYADVQIIRIVQEALANVRKHADAKEVTISANADQDLLTIDVTDNGKGISLPEPGAARFGVAIMRERAESAGGTMEIGQGPHGGTRVHVEIPFTLRPTTPR